MRAKFNSVSAWCDRTHTYSDVRVMRVMGTSGISYVQSQQFIVCHKHKYKSWNQSGQPDRKSPIHCWFAHCFNIFVASCLHPPDDCGIHALPGSLPAIILKTVCHDTQMPRKGRTMWSECEGAPIGNGGEKASWHNTRSDGGVYGTDGAHNLKLEP